MAQDFFHAQPLTKTKRRGRSAKDLTDMMPEYVHADYVEWRDIWRSIRHAMVGEPAIKREATRYLPQLDGMEDDQYEAYLDRAVFFNMTYRTVTGLTGAIFRRSPRLMHAGEKMKKLADNISKDNLSLELLAKVISQEQLSVGRTGLLLDKSPQDDADPYLTLYTAENIVDWTMVEINGRNEYDFILLREFYTDRRPFIMEGDDNRAQRMPNPTYGELFVRLRALRLHFDEVEDRWEYVQEVYEKDNADADLTVDPVIITPLVYGKPFDRIPFAFFNATTALSSIEKPPVLDILSINLSHYKSYAALEQGRFFTANPVYYVKGGDEQDEYHIGPSLVWDLDVNGEAGIIEYNGHGLRSLENALTTKETQAASLGGRLIGDSSSAGQSDNQIKLKDRNEQSLLLNVTTVLNENFTKLLRQAAKWINEEADNEELVFRVNQDFLLNNFAAREFRAITLMWQEGLLPIDVIYEFFLQHEVIPEYIDLETFKILLEDEQQFINNPDVAAKQEGFPDAQSKIDVNEAEKDRKASEEKIPAIPSQASQANLKDQLLPRSSPT